MFNIVSHQGNANQNHNEIPLHTHKDDYNPKKGKKMSAMMWRNWNHAGENIKASAAMEKLGSFLKI